MGAAWRPGDVAVAEVPTKTTPGASLIAEGKSRIVVVKADKGWIAAENSDYFWADDYAFFSDGPRPLAVIDPEDRDQVKRLSALHDAAWEIVRAAHPDRVGTPTWEIWQQALRLTLDPTPSKPEEPTGLGAVVEDADGRQWVNFGNGCWIKTVPNAGLQTTGYDLIAVAKVLSAGVHA